MKKVQTIHEELARDLTEVFFKMVRENQLTSANEIIRHVLYQKAPRFYVSFENTRRHLSNLKKGTPIWEKNKNKKLLYAELYRRWRAANGGKDYEKNSYVCLHDIISSQAPCFYIDSETARGIIYKYLRRKRARA